MFPFQENDKEEFPEDKLTWTQSLIIDLGLKEHPDGGYYAETDRSPFAIRNPLGDGDPLDNMRPTSTAIYYLLNTARPNQFFHRNQSRTIHSLHEGVGICLLLYPPEMSSKTAHIQELYKAKRGRKTNIDTFGGYERRRLDNGWTIEKFGVGREFGIYQWVVEGGVYKASFLLDYDSSFGYIEPERKQIEDVHNRDGLFITEVVSPGFDLADHNFMNKETFNDIFHTKELRAEQTNDGEKHWVEGGVSDPKTNFESEQHDVDIQEVADASLDVNGFEYCTYPTAETFASDASITTGYYHEIEQLLLSHCKASRVVIFDHTIRRPGTNRGPISRVHVDQTTKAAIARVERHVPDLAAQLIQSRFQIINVWRPIKPVEKDPLALCDFQSVDPSDMIETDRIDFSSDVKGETYGVAYNAQHKWYYMKNMQPEQVVLIKCFDSSPDPVARYCPHSAFKHGEGAEHVFNDPYFSKRHLRDTLREAVKLGPLVAALIAPLSVLLDIPALTQPWYGREDMSLTDDKTSLILSAFSLFFNVMANALLLVRFSINTRLRFTVATRVSMVFWALKVIVALVNLIIFGVYRNNAPPGSPRFTYLEGFWCAVVSCVIAGISTFLLFAHYIYEFDPKAAFKGSEIRLMGRGFMINVTFLITSIGLQGLIFSRIEHWTYLEGLYFSTVTVLTVGFGDYEPTTTAGKILLFPCILIGISQLAVVVSEIIDFFSQRSPDARNAIRRRVEQGRLRQENRMKTIDINEEIGLLEKAQKKQQNRDELIALSFSLTAFFLLWFLGALIFSKLEGWTYGNGLYFCYIFFLTVGFGDFTPTSPAGKVVFIVYALGAVPIITSFAVQSVVKIMSLLSERRLIRHKRNALGEEVVPVTHGDLLDQAVRDIDRSRKEDGLQNILIDVVLQMDLCTRKLLSKSLDGRDKMVLKADTLCQLRNSDYDVDKFAAHFDKIEVDHELNEYRRYFAKFLTLSSEIKQLEGEEQRIFERRMNEEQNISETTEIEQEKSV